LLICYGFAIFAYEFNWINNMMPNETQEMAAKILFIIFAILMIGLTKVNAKSSRLNIIQKTNTSTVLH
jgi:hypothetical protein